MNYLGAEPPRYQAENVLTFQENHPFSNFPFNTADAEHEECY